MEYVFGFMIVLFVAHIRVLRKVSSFNEWLYSLDVQLDQINERIPREVTRIEKEAQRLRKEAGYDE